jgi:hypothetical protein
MTVTKKEYMSTNYHTSEYYVIPLLNIKLKKLDYIKNGKCNNEDLYKDALKFYEENQDKFI